MATIPLPPLGKQLHGNASECSVADRVVLVAGQAHSRSRLAWRRDVKLTGGWSWDSTGRGWAMRVPLVRFGGDETSIAWWEWLFTPVVVAAILLECLAMILYLLVYPERQAFDWDAGTERQREFMSRFRRRAARLSIWKRLGRVLT